MLLGILLVMTTARAEPLAVAFPPPAGAARAEADAFGAWLRTREVLPPDRPVRTHDGRVVRHRARVVDLPLVPGDLQQCADSLLRLRATWERAVGRPPLFHATNGDPLPWTRWSNGERPVLRNDRIAWVPGGDRSFDGWLRHVFVWAGSASLHAHDTVADDHPDPGDVLVHPGFPGHAVILLDVARDEAGATWVLVGEGYMPAQDFHVELGPRDGWWRWEDGVTVPWGRLGADTLRRWR